MQPIAKKTWKQVDGVLLLDKPVGISSNDALQKARRLLSAARGGHTGTLDPLASGLLPLCFGEATKFSADLLAADKAAALFLAAGVVTYGRAKRATDQRAGKIVIRNRCASRCTESAADRRIALRRIPVVCRGTSRQRETGDCGAEGCFKCGHDCLV